MKKAALAVVAVFAGAALLRADVILSTEKLNEWLSKRMDPGAIDHRQTEMEEIRKRLKSPGGAETRPVLELRRPSAPALDEVPLLRRNPVGLTPTQNASR